MCLAPRFEIVSLRNADDGSTWRALLLEGEQLGHLRFVAPAGASADEARRLIHAAALDFEAGRSAIAQFRELPLAA
jgi:hypothetical protein